MAYFEIDALQLAIGKNWPHRCARCFAPTAVAVSVPLISNGNLPPWSLPLCPQHTDDWTATRRRNRIGIALVLAALVLIASLVWLLYPLLNPGMANGRERFAIAMVATLLSIFPLGLLLVLWAKTPIRVAGRNGRFVQIAGVCGAFAKAMAKVDKEAPLPDVPDGVAFAAERYRPKSQTPFDTALLFFAVSLLAASLLGAMIAWGGFQLSQAVLGWPPADWRYNALTALPAAFAAWVIRGPTKLFNSRWIAISLALGLVFGASTLVLSLFNGEPQLWFAIAYSIAPLVALQAVVIYPILWNGKLRNGWLAAGVTFLANVAYSGVIFAVCRWEEGPHFIAVYAGPILGLILANENYGFARSPYCAECSGWLTKARIGAFPRTRETLVKVLDSGEIIALANDAFYVQKAAIGDTELTGYQCPGCREQGSLVIELEDCVKGGKNGRTPTLKSFDLWLYPGSALPVLQKLFPLLVLAGTELKNFDAETE